MKPTLQLKIPLIHLISFFILFQSAFGGSTASANNLNEADIPDYYQTSSISITGKVTAASDGFGLPGVSVYIKGTTQGTLTNSDGSFTLEVPSNESILVFSYVGFITQEIRVGAQRVINVMLEEDVTALEEVVIVGYGEQKKESVVAAISQTNNEVINRTGGVASVGQALTGNLPGLTTISGNGAPGDENPQILIRARSSWNGSGAPLVLVDGIERDLNSLDPRSIENISVLKDASATAVFGVKGANGVILVTTKRGQEGRAQVNLTANAIMKVPSRLPQKYDSYDALAIRNEAIERELAISPGSWNDYTPFPLLDKYRNPENRTEADRFPNVDWVDESVDDFVMSYSANVNVSGGTKAVKYFTSLDYLSEGDIMKVWENGKGYTPGYGFDRLNLRTNLDFQITPSTTVKANIAGLYGSKQNTWSGFEYRIWQGAYANPPDAMPVQYEDGTWAWYAPNPINVMNSPLRISNNGIRNENTTQINTDVTIVQDLDRLLKGLSVRAQIAFDNQFQAVGGLYDEAGNVITKYVTQEGEEIFERTIGSFNYDPVINPWELRPIELQNGFTFRRNLYQFRVNHDIELGGHSISTLGLFQRDVTNRGNGFPTRREDWVVRSRYNYEGRYFAEVNGAYNGSEKFGPGYKFDFFPSFAAGWLLSDESFMSNVNWLNALKLRGSWGLVGEDAPGPRFAYLTQWDVGGQSRIGTNPYGDSPYVWYRVGVEGNPDLRWETVQKTNVGLDYTLFDGLLYGSFDYFQDYRYDIILGGNERSIPDYFGGTPPVGNLGEVRTRGFELAINAEKYLANGMRLWGNLFVTRATDVTVFRDDPELLEDYLKDEGYAIGQTRTIMNANFFNTYDQMYASTIYNENDANKLPGNWNFIDFNADGIINQNDIVPYAYPTRPQNTYSSNLGVDYRGFSIFVQFYAVTQVTRNLTQENFSQGLNRVFRQGTFFDPENPEAAELPYPRWSSQIFSYGNFYQYNAAYFRLKNAEIAYTFDSKVGFMQNSGIKAMKIFLNGNNLLLWTELPDDRESNLGGNGGQGAYPTVRRFNLGINVTL